MVSQRFKNDDKTKTTLVSIPVRGSGKSKLRKLLDQKFGSNVSIPVRGSGKSKFY